MASLSTRNFTPGFPKQVGVSGTTNAGPLLQAIPNVAADLTTTDTFLFQLSVTNGSGGALTFTLKDIQGSPIEAAKITSVASGVTAVYYWPEGLFFKGGLNWVASAGGLTAGIVAFYK